MPTSDDYTPSTDEVRRRFSLVQTGGQCGPREFDRWLESVRAEERERIARMVRAEVDGWDRGGRYAKQKHTMFNRLADRIAREGA